MVVDIAEPGLKLPSSAFLQLYDRRFADQLRRDNGVEGWTVELEHKYLQSVRSGAAEKFLYSLHNVPNFQEVTEDDWNDWQNEAFLDDELLKLCKAETATYNKLCEQQGKTVPKFLAAVDLNLAAGADLTASPNSLPGPPKLLDFQPFHVKGILLEYIDGFNLRQVPEYCPRSTWQDIVDQAVSIVRLMGDYNILNRDVRPENFIVSPLLGGQEVQQYRVFMIDFGLCRIRREDETDLQWGMAKCTKDEEGAVGLVMQMILKRDYGFELHYERSGRYDEWADTDESHPEGSVRIEVAPGTWMYEIPRKQPRK